MLDRFYHSPLLGQLGDLVSLSDDEAHHASRVLRKVSGDAIELFDGDGRSVRALLVDVRKKQVTAELAGSVEEDRSRASELIIATAAPKADRFKWLVEKATELGVDRLIPLECERSVVHPGGSKLDRLRAGVIAACKQSGRNRLMAIDEPISLNEALTIPAGRRVFADVPLENEQRDERQPDKDERDGTKTEKFVSGGDAKRSRIEQTLVLIGPEGGWSESERVSADAAGFATEHVGEHVLRVETAVISFAAIYAQR